MKKICFVSIFVVLGFLLPAAMAELLYHEGFVINNPQYKAGNFGSFSDFGWSVYAEDGVDYSSSAANPVMAAYDAGSPDGDSYRAAIGSGATLDFVMISDASGIAPSQRDGLLTFSFQHRDAYNSGDMRFLALVDGTWYASDAYAAVNSGWVSASVSVESALWYAWESSLSDGFERANISSTGSALASGTITSVGLVVNNLSGGDYYRIDDFNMNGSVVPEPATVLLLSFGMLVSFLSRKIQG